MWLDKKEQSKWAWEEIQKCKKDGKDDKEFREMLTDSTFALRYCTEFSDDPEVRKNITREEDVYKYCKLVKKDDEVRNRIKSSKWALKYCLIVEDHPSIRSRIINSKEAFQYCTTVNDCPEVAKRINKGRWFNLYMDWKIKKEELISCTFKYNNKKLLKKLEEKSNDNQS